MIMSKTKQTLLGPRKRENRMQCLKRAGKRLPLKWVASRGLSEEVTFELRFE